MSHATVTDLYEASMALSFLREGMTRDATFSLFVRGLPPGRGFLVSAGLEPVLDFLTDFRVTSEDTRDFAAALGSPPGEVGPLVGLGFDGEVRAVPEGRVVLPGEPLLEVTAPLPQAQLVETWLLGQVSHQTAVASKAARCVLAAAGRPVVDFSLRRGHGPEAGMQTARVGAMVGFAGTSNVAASLKFGLRASGTMAHSYIEAFGDEEAAFTAYARSRAGPVTFLVDTYDTADGVVTAARVLNTLRRGPGSAIRLDSGDLAELARRSRAILDAAGLPDVAIIASGGLDEYGVDRLVRSGAPIDVYAVGTKVGTSSDAPYLDSAYKLVEYDGRPVMKLSASKVTAPGRKQVLRGDGLDDVITLADEDVPGGGEPLLRRVMSGGRRTGPPDTLAAAHDRFTADLAAVPEHALRIQDPEPPVAAVSARLSALTSHVRRRLEKGVEERREERAGPDAGPPDDRPREEP
ncbi:nicotinate phosphoribosyltransferase [Streptomyces sp. NBC_01174]|uniref:nicotinate phosphoribosyltransferase n=1 Tax=Streptomyces sp. NBC_01174 TaxID=2903758 RepID=UPI00386D6ABB|nr:nicotinate phosphoribosyltransferase [Streptomyces sp. NBC_01177]WSS74013.1 nicotinate phosphoribosyltransferase [Streptomyces sp. NBC_01174]WSS80580.1 nicotinate phosphoribosyltransferase [Streptomyces sp. NBC_01174]